MVEQDRMVARLAEIRPFLDERAWRLLLLGPRRTGIDCHLRIIAERHGPASHPQLGVIDPIGLVAGRRGWPLVGVLTWGPTTGPGPD